MCFNNFCGFNRCRCHRFNEESSSCNIRHRRHHREESSSNMNNVGNTFNIRTAFNQDDFCRAVRQCNQRNRRNRRHHNWE